MAAWRSWRARNRGTPCLWLALGAGFVVAALGAFLGRPPAMPGPWKSAIDALLGPFTITLGSLALLIGLFLGRRLLVIPAVAWTGFNVSLLFWERRSPIRCSPPCCSGRTTYPSWPWCTCWPSLSGWGPSKPSTTIGGLPAERRRPKKTRGAGPRLAQPGLHRTDLHAAAVRRVDRLVRRRAGTLEQPANPMLTPNPSKAPWYFVGLQEMLVLLNPTMAGVILPCLIIVGLAALPYVDRNPKGNGYYTIAERRFSYAVFLLGFSPVLDPADSGRDFSAGPELGLLWAVRAARPASDVVFQPIEQRSFHVALRRHLLPYPPAARDLRPLGHGPAGGNGRDVGGGSSATLEGLSADLPRPDRAVDGRGRFARAGGRKSKM